MMHRDEINESEIQLTDDTVFIDACTKLINTFINEECDLHALPIIQSPEKNVEFLSANLSDKGIGLAETVALFTKTIATQLPRNYTTRFFNWVVGGRTQAAVLGDFYSTVYDQIVMLAGHSIAVEVEAQTIQWLLELFSLPASDFTGVFTTGATEANICALAAARQWYGESLNVDISQEGLFNLQPPTFISGMPHSSIDKALQMLGLGRNHIIKIKNHEAKLDIVKLENLLQKNPTCIVIANCGEVNTGSSDDLIKISELCQQYNAWLHVDAAFGLFARCSEQYTHLTTGIQHADSITCDGHKLGNVPYGCGFIFIKKNKYPYLQKSFATVASYLSANHDHPMNTRIANSQRFLGLPMWFSLLTYGKQGYADMVNRQCAFAQALSEWIKQHTDFELILSVKFNIILFRYKNILIASDNQCLINLINATNLLSLSGTIFNELPALRIAVANWHTDISHDLQPTITGLEKGLREYKNSQGY